MGVHAILNYAYTDATIARDALDPNFGFALRRGDPLINVPKNSASAIVYRTFTIAGHAVTLGGTLNYVERRVGQTGYRDAAGDLFTLPGYVIGGVNGAVELTPELRLQVEATNVSNATYYPSSYSRVWVTPGAPRQVIARLRMSL